MKLSYWLFPIVILGLIFIFSEKVPPQRQAQEADPTMIQLTDTTYKITLEIESENDRAIADILWFHEAAKLAMKRKIPWFNVIEEKINPYEVEGVIELIRDPMKAEYDANEILSLQLSHR